MARGLPLLRARLTQLTLWSAVFSAPASRGKAGDGGTGGSRARGHARRCHGSAPCRCRSTRSARVYAKNEKKGERKREREREREREKCLRGGRMIEGSKRKREKTASRQIGSRQETRNGMTNLVEARAKEKRSLHLDSRYRDIERRQGR